MISWDELNGSFDWQGVRGLLLDLDNTMYEYRPQHERGLRACHRYLAETAFAGDFERFAAGYEAAKREVKTFTDGQGASHSRFLYFQRYLEGLQDRTDLELTAKLERLYWESFMTGMSLDLGCRMFLEKAKSRGVKVCVVTDLTTPIQFEKLLRLGVRDLVDYVVSSEEAGAEKPETSMFRLALQKLRMQAGDVVLIGDDEKKDGGGGEKMGIKTIIVAVGG